MAQRAQLFGDVQGHAKRLGLVADRIHDRPRGSPEHNR